jgi:hypothetical protein
VNFSPIEQAFLARGHVRGGILFLDPALALEMIEVARSQQVPVAGVDGFFLTEASTQPSMEHSLDLGGAWYRVNTWDEAAQFIKSKSDLGLRFEITLVEDSPV